MSTPVDELSDAELVLAWQRNRDQQAVEVLFERHHAHVYRRSKYALPSASDAEDVTNDAFIRLYTSLDSYDEKGKFTHFLNTIVRTTIIDWYRKRGDPVPDALLDNEDIAAEGPGPDLITDIEGQIKHLTTVCIPSLPAKERLVYLLMNEAVFWDYDTPLTWTELATLNGIDTNTAWSRFEFARRALFQGKSVKELDDEHLIIFLVWTECKRAFKKNQPLKYFAELIDENEQTLKNRSFSARRKLKACMQSFIQEP